MVCVWLLQSECEQRGESYWYSVTASVVTRIVENIEVSHPTLAKVSVYINEGRLNNRTMSLCNSLQFNSTTNCMLAHLYNCLNKNWTFIAGLLYQTCHDLTYKDMQNWRNTLCFCLAILYKAKCTEANTKQKSMFCVDHCCVRCAWESQLWEML